MKGINWISQLHCFKQSSLYFLMLWHPSYVNLHVQDFCYKGTGDCLPWKGSTLWEYTVVQRSHSIAVSVLFMWGHCRYACDTVLCVSSKVVNLYIRHLTASFSSSIMNNQLMWMLLRLLLRRRRNVADIRKRRYSLTNINHIHVKVDVGSWKIWVTLDFMH